MAAGDEISIMVEGLRAALARSELQATELQEQKARTESHLASVQTSLQAANARLEELQSNLARLEELKSEHYQRLISDMFSVPAKEASRQTVKWALVSIAVTAALTLGATLWSLNEGAVQATQTVSFFANSQGKKDDALSERLRSLSDSVQGIRQDLSDYYSTETALSEQVARAFDVVKEESHYFDNYKTLDDVGRMYKLVGVLRLSPLSPLVFGRALTRFGVSPHIVQQAKEQQSRWGREALTLYTNWEKSLSLQQDQLRYVTSSELKLQQYADPSDRTAYTDLKRTSEATPRIFALRMVLRNKISAVQGQMSIHP